MRNLNRISLLALLIALLFETLPQYSIARESESFTRKTDSESNGFVVTEEGAWCWFADPRALHHKNDEGTINSTYIGYIDVHGNIKATQYNFITGKSNEVLIRSYFQPDDHNNPSFLVLPDDRVMIFYSRHTDEACFYYRISTVPGDITSLGPELKIETKYNTTYPSPFLLSADPEHFYLCWRGIKWHPTIARYTLPNDNDLVERDWGPYQMVQSTADRPYCKYFSNDTDKIYLAYTTGHPDVEFPNHTYFNYIDVKTLQLKDIEGKVLSSIEEGPHAINTNDYPSLHPKAVVDSPADQRDWIWQTTLDKNNSPVLAMVQISKDKSVHNYYHVKWNGNSWEKTFLAYGGGHFHQSDKIEHCYSGGMALDGSNPNIVYCSVPVEGNSGEVYELMQYTVSSGKVIGEKQITQNSALNNVRPYCVKNAGESPLKLIWMHGNYYDWIVSSYQPKGFSTAIHSEYPLPAENIKLKKQLVMNETFEGSVEGNATTIDGLLHTTSETLTTLKGTKSKAFSILLTPCLKEAAYEGTVLKIGKLSYQMDKSSLKPYISIGEKTFASNNLLGTSDEWQNQRRGTGGKWYTPVMLKRFNLTLTYEENRLTVYRNGLIDQVVEVENLNAEEIILGGFEGTISNCRIYKRALNQSEVKQLANNML